MRSKPLNMPPTNYKFFPFNGGLDLVTPPIEMAIGALRAASNVEIGINGGYTRLAGYERYSGQAKPSAASYAVLTCTITGAVAVGNVLTDDAATAFGTVIAIASGQLVLARITGIFAAGNIKVAGVVVGSCVGQQANSAAATPALNASYLNLAADVSRALISAVPGSGAVLGVHQYGGNVYAFRNNAGGTAAVMHKQSATGWVPVALGREVAFTSGGVFEVVAGQTITGATSAATAVVTKVILTSGTWATGTAAGRLFFAAQTGTFQAENINVGASLDVGTIAGNTAAITLLPGGRYEFYNWNFGGGLATQKMYGVDGVNQGFEFDGATLVKIRTGMLIDAPSHVFVNKNQLFYSFQGSAQHSGIGNPYSFSVVSGASELACGDTITGFLGLAGTEQGSAMAIYTRNRTLVLYGNSPADWNLVSYSEEAGARAHTLQFITQGVVLDDQGITLLGTTQNYGNFQNAVTSDKVTPLLNDLINSASASCIGRRKNQYRLFFSGGDGLYMTFKDRKIMGITPVTLPNPVNCISSAEGAGGLEEIYFGSSNGMVYQMEVGTSFDGEPIGWYAELSFNHFGGPRQLKTFRKAVTDINGSGYCEFNFTHSLAYGSSEFDSSANQTQISALSAVNWDSFTWDQFFWDGRTLMPSERDITGTAENISLMYSGRSDQFEPFTLNSAIIHYSPRRGMR